MMTNSLPPLLHISPPQRGLTLVELLAVLAVLAILAAAMLPVLIRQMDRVAGERESGTLKSFAESLAQSALRKHTIPSHTNWAATIAAELGVGTDNVTRNSRNQPRYFLI